MIAPLGARYSHPSAAQATIERLLLEDGIGIDHAGSAGEALSRFTSEEHDLVILTHDESTPGAQALAEGVSSLRARAAALGRRFVPVLMMSSAPEHAAAQEARSLGADDVLSLAVSPQIAHARVRAYLALSARGGRAPSGSGSQSPRPASGPWRHDLTQRLVHDLRNPLAGLASNLSYVDDRLGRAADPEVVEALADCRAAVGRLRRAATMLVDVGPLEEGSLRPRLVEGPVVPMVQDLFAQRLHEASLRDLKLVADVPPGCSASFDQELTPRLLHALLDHALRYAAPGSQVQLQVCPRDRPGLTLRLTAGGDWLPRERSAAAQDPAPLPFGVAEVGLGLHYAHLVARAHGGGIQVIEEPAAPRRTSAIVTL